VLIKSDQIDPHHIDSVIFGVSPNGADSTVTIQDVMACNDDINAPTLRISVERTNFPPGASCNVDHCGGYLPDHHGTGLCTQPGCGHGFDHHGLGQRCRLDACPGFLTGDGSNSGLGVCVQPGCGHDEDQHGPKGKDHKDKDKEKDKEHSPHEKLPEFFMTHRPPNADGDKIVAVPSTGLDHDVANIVHFIRPELRPDVSASALRHLRADAGASVQLARQAQDAKDVEKDGDR
jgi:hypothetical protein